MAKSPPQVYRELLRAIRLAFLGDTPTLLAARTEARNQFSQARNIGEPSEVDTRLQHAEEVTQILRQNVVQGVKDKDEDTFKLRVHEDIERGDNETIKLKTKLAGRTAKIDKSA